MGGGRTGSLRGDVKLRPKGKTLLCSGQTAAESTSARVRGRPGRRAGVGVAEKRVSSWLLHLTAVALGRGHGQNLIIKWTQEF